MVEFVPFFFDAYGYLGADTNPDMLTLSDQLLKAVLAEAWACCADRYVVMSGALNADLTLMPCLSEGIASGNWVDLKKTFAAGRREDPTKPVF